jgi:ribosomal silencing factor RsfS
MDELSPDKMLELYRQQSGPIHNKQAELFAAMPISKQLELMFYMIMHTTMAVQHVHKLVDEEAAKTVDMPPLEKPN